MKIIGIIIEANPLHNGHQYLIDKVKKDENPDLLIALTTTYFSMRGDISCYPKVDKVKYLLNAGFDIVLEFPTILCMQRSDIFAKNAIKILNDIKITHLAFGMETNNPVLINKATKIYTSDEFKNEFDNKIKANANYKKAQIDTLKPYFSNDEWGFINNSNFFLGLEYLKYLKNTDISPIIIKRIGPGYDELHEKNNLASATYLRTLLKNNNSVDKYLNYAPCQFINLNKAENNLFKFWQFTSLIKPHLIKKTSINNYLLNNTNLVDTYEDFISHMTTNKITKTRIKRTIINNLIDSDYWEMSDTVFLEPYLRLLGFNYSGRKYLNFLPKELKKFLFSNPNKLKFESIVLNHELKIAKFYDLITEKNFYITEYQFPIRKDNK